MDDVIASHVERYRSRLQALIRRGSVTHDALDADPSDPAALMEARRWQQDCGVTVNELSGGNKAHWLARAFSDAFLVRAPGTRAVKSVPPAEIVQRLIGVLEQAQASLARDDAPRLVGSADVPSPHRFDFVHNADLRPVLEQAYSDGRRDFARGDYDLALRTYCVILEAVVTDALEHNEVRSAEPADKPERSIADWSFRTRLNVAEKRALIGHGCARLPSLAWSYRDADSGTGVKLNVSEREARLTGQVLHVIMRDLNPGR
jgi:hypothetical protein